MRRWASCLLAVAVLTGTATAVCAARVHAQVTEGTYWRAAGLYSRAFGGRGWGGMLGVTRGLFSEGMLVGGLGVDVAWSRPRLFGDRAPGVPSRRDLVTLDLHLRTRLTRGPVAVELGLPVGVVRSAVGRGSDGDADTGVARQNRSGTFLGPTAGLLAAVRGRVGSGFSILAEYEVVRAWIYGGTHWLETYSFGFQAPLQ